MTLSRPRKLVLVLCLGLVVAWVAAAAVLFLWPPQHVPQHADTVVVLAGTHGPRLARGLALVRGGVAPVLVISDGWSATWPEANRLCAGRPGPVPVICLHPSPYSTRGEAEAFTHLASSRGWTSVVVVSSRYHVARARILFERCFKGTVYTDGANQSLLSRVLAVPSETAKLAYALVVRRGC
jgi:uncharacterized SAM-binding protein YcdF (DUF218 family)